MARMRSTLVTYGRIKIGESETSVPPCCQNYFASPLKTRFLLRTWMMAASLSRDTYIQVVIEENWENVVAKKQSIRR